MTAGDAGQHLRRHALRSAPCGRAHPLHPPAELPEAQEEVPALVDGEPGAAAEDAAAQAADDDASLTDGLSELSASPGPSGAVV